MMVECNEFTKEQFLEATNRIKDVLKETKLVYSNIFSKESGNDIYIKPENLQVTGAFKIRGAYNKISKLTEEEKKKGLITSSAGNHAQGVALAAQRLGVKATIVMPKATPLIKVEATKNFGANVVLHGDCYDEAYEEAKRLEEKNGYTFVHPFNDIDVIEGQGTIAIEILNELKDVDCIIVPVGGGGLISGIAVAAKLINPKIKIIGVEPEGANAVKLSIENDKVISLDNLKTIADGVAVKTPGDLNFKLIKKYVDEIVTVSDLEVMEAFLILLEKHKLIGETSGVLPLAALRKINEKNKKIACVISGGNIDVLTIASMIDRGLVSRGRKFCFTVELLDKPGQLQKVSQILGDLNANIIKLDHNKFKTFDAFMQVQLEVTVETNGHEHVQLITDELERKGFKIVKVY
ncbi:threonine ammonia-lyase [Clostridium folliculivorans]|uniref:L-threonine dehydratase catabolic TdcB n=1 Tax=Clostridium folliculivorans TaxID=2886038 RepID=A0A9W6DC94_9CLOT|nr:threonine ammonia-lyase [Clostridium folliculivorans]GKU26762.1 threonine ammonia-lyase [Clostridium folliculivorans]GKU31356.1 threonine ammonia-lyase [Clostridium folliculivorans]